jgi:ectoine hydroxylase-related dioxygenase (phytanoyl-CoA dioxygenase family)
MTHEPNLHLTDEHVDFFWRNGFLAIEQISSPEEICVMRAAYDKIFQQKSGRDEGNQFDLAGTDEENKEAALPQILNPAKYAPELKNTLAEKNARAFSAQLFSRVADASAMTGGVAHAIFKPARVGASTPWHQDEAYWNPEFHYQSLSVWMPLQEATLENGCMQFIPGTHELEVLPHHSIGHDPRVHGLEADENIGVDFSQAVACPLPAGGCTLHLSRTFHFTGANTSDVPRRALIMSFGLPHKPLIEKRRFPWNENKMTARKKRAEQFQNSAEK